MNLFQSTRHTKKRNNIQYKNSTLLWFQENDKVKSDWNQFYVVLFSNTFMRQSFFLWNFWLFWCVVFMDCLSVCFFFLSFNLFLCNTFSLTGCVRHLRLTLLPSFPICVCSNSDSSFFITLLAHLFPAIACIYRFLSHSLAEKNRFLFDFSGYIFFIGLTQSEPFVCDKQTVLSEMLLLYLFSQKHNLILDRTPRWSFYLGFKIT